MSSPTTSEPAPAGGAHSKRPSSSRFRQQQLPAWQPILTAGTVLPALFVIGVAFIPIGIALLTFSGNVQELKFEYTNCNSTGHGGAPCSEVVANASEPCTCELEFNVTRPLEGQVFVYYGLTNFYQNHRRYVKSRSDEQLQGAANPSIGDCAPFDKRNGKTVAPCGAIANSLFNDTFQLTLVEADGAAAGAQEKNVTMVRTGIAWPSDKNWKFQNPPGALNAGGAFANTVKPANWWKPVYELDPEHPANNGYEYEDLIVWMRTAALPTFRKLWARVDESAVPFKNSLPAGRYRLRVDYHYPVTSFGGTKSLILSTTSLLGGKNPFLGVAYVVVGCVCLLLGVAFLFIHIKYGKRGTDNVTSHSNWAEH